MSVGQLPQDEYPFWPMESIGSRPPPQDAAKKQCLHDMCTCVYIFPMNALPHPSVIEFGRIGRFVYDKHAEGMLSSEESAKVIKCYLDIVNGQMTPADFGKTDSATYAIFRHANHAMKQTLVALHPEWRREIHALGQMDDIGRSTGGR